MSSRPRRKVRGVDDSKQAESSTSAQKRKATPDNPNEEDLHKGESPTNKTRVTGEGRPGTLEWMLSSVKSPLCTIEMSKVINESTWFSLSAEDRMELSRLLPSTVYPFFEPELPYYHPSKHQMGPEPGNPAPVDPLAPEERPYMELSDIEADPSAFLTCPYFESAQTAFRDHLYSGWFAKGHLQDLEKFRSGINDGSMHAHWKNEAWEGTHLEIGGNTGNDNASAIHNHSQQDLERLIHHRLVSEGDIITYKRSFPQLDESIEKDIYVFSAHSRSGLVIVLPPGSTASLPPSMVGSNPTPRDSSNLQQTSVQSLEELENTVLDIDGRVPRSERVTSNVNDVWKRFSVWKQTARLVEEYDALEAIAVSFQDSEAALNPRGGRENRGTMFYLRGAYIT